eukprot:scaffold27017_cov61-Phaeocystis_antarctica.AAC.4
MATRAPPLSTRRTSLARLVPTPSRSHFRSAARRLRAGHRAVRCMRSSPPKTATTARTSPSSPWPTPRASSSARSRRRCPSRPSSATTSWPRLQPMSRRLASSRTSTGGCPHARRRPIARRLAMWRRAPGSSRAVTTRTTQRVSSGRPPSATSSLARRRSPRRPACACPRGCCWGDSVASLAVVQAVGGPTPLLVKTDKAVAEHKAATES